MTASCAQSLPRSLAPPRTAILTSADLSFRQRVRDALTGLRWQVREAGGGAEALAYLDAAPAEAVILDSWLPDLEIGEFIAEFEKLHPGIDLVALGDLTAPSRTMRSPRRNEVLFALRHGQEGDNVAGNDEPPNYGSVGRESPARAPIVPTRQTDVQPAAPARMLPSPVITTAGEHIESGDFAGADLAAVTARSEFSSGCRLPEFIGTHPVMLEVSRRIRLVAGHRTSVLVQGPTGSGKELVARALHRLSPRTARPFIALNCAAIPEALLEAELFGHSRGAFTGAVQGRVGRIEAAHGGTLFLDEIGEMPLACQAKLLRFVESGELQRVGDNELIKVDVRLIAATHRSLARLAGEGGFRSDLYFRLSVFLIRTPALSAHIEDLPRLTAHFLERMSQQNPAKSLSEEALSRLLRHRWPGNVRELEHVLERAWILAEDRPRIAAAEVEFGEEYDTE